MHIPKGTLNQLFKSLSSYNPVTNQAMEKIATVLQPVGIAILAILFLLELQNYSRKFDSEEGGLTANVYLSIAMKYLVAYFLIMTSSKIVDGVVWFGIQIAKWINSVVVVTGTNDVIKPLAKMKMWERPIPFLFRILTYVSMAFASWTAKIIIFLRAIDLYIIKAVAPIMVAFFVHDELRSITINFLKYVMAVVFQGAILLLILGLIPILTANDFSSFNSLDGSVWQNAGTIIKNVIEYVGLICKYVVIIILLIGSQRKAKQLMGAM